MAILRFSTGEGTNTHVYLPEGCEQVDPFSNYIENIVHFDMNLISAF